MKAIFCYFGIVLASLVAVEAVFRETDETDEQLPTKETLPGYDSRRVIVTFKNSGSKFVTQNLVALGEVYRELGPQNAIVTYMTPDRIQTMQYDPSIAKIEVDLPRYPLSAVPPLNSKHAEHTLRGAKLNSTTAENNNGAKFARRALSQASSYALSMIQADQVTQDPKNKKRICIIDSGYANTHEDLPKSANGTHWYDIQGNLVARWDTDVCGHGTHVAGTIAALDNNAGVKGVIAGPSPNEADVYIVKVFGDNCGWTYASDIIHAVNLCVSPKYGNSKIVSMSLGCADVEGCSVDVEEQAFNRYYDEGVIFVAAAGNEGGKVKAFPASYPAVVSVAAVDENGEKASFSNSNNQVELAAPGVGILSTYFGYFANFESPLGTQRSASQIQLTPDGQVNGKLQDCGLALTKCPASVKDNICLIQRGSDSFYNKIVNCERAGGIGAVIYNNAPGNFDGTIGDGKSVRIPAVSISQEDGALLKSQRVGKVAKIDVGITTGYKSMKGTSMATPHVSAVVALVWSRHPQCTAKEIRTALQLTAKDKGIWGRDDDFGFGIVQAKAADNYLAASGCGTSGAVQTDPDTDEEQKETDPPTALPTKMPTVMPTKMPTTMPTEIPTKMPTIESDPSVLKSGVPKLIDGGLDEKMNFTMYLDDGTDAVTCAISGGTGDADLYTRWNLAVDFENQSSNTCVPWKHGNEEECSIEDLGTTGSVLHVGILGYREFAGVSLVCTAWIATTVVPQGELTAVPTLAPSPDGPKPLKLGKWVTVNGKKGDRLDFTCDVPDGARDMVVRTRKGAGNANLYASFDRPNVIGKGERLNDCVRKSKNNFEKCKGFKNLGKTLYITVYAAKDFWAVQVKCFALYKN